MANFSKNNVMKMKIGIVAIVLSVVCAIILVGRLFYLQIIEGDKYKQMALNQQLKDTIIEPHRGSIYISQQHIPHHSSAAGRGQAQNAHAENVHSLADTQNGAGGGKGHCADHLKNKEKAFHSFIRLSAPFP